MSIQGVGMYVHTRCRDVCPLVPCAGLEFDPKPSPQLAVKSPGPAQARNYFSSPAQARKLELRPRPEPDRECLAQAWPGPQVSGPGPAHTRGPKMGRPAARKPASLEKINL